MKNNGPLLEIITDESKAKEWFIDFKKNKLPILGELEVVFNDYIKEFEEYYKTYSRYLMGLKYIDLTREEAQEQLKFLIDNYENSKQFDDFIDSIINNENKDNKLYKFVSGISLDSLQNIKMTLEQGQNIDVKDICIMGIYKDDIEDYDKKDFSKIFETEVKSDYITLTQLEKDYLEQHTTDKENEPLDVKVFKLKKIRESNMEQKYTHTIRMLAITLKQLDTELYKDMPGIIKASILVSVLFHDLGRFYQAAFYNEFIESELSKFELDYTHEIDEFLKGNTNSQGENLSHSVLGFYFSLNSFKNLNSLEPNNFKKIIDAVAAYAIRKHSLSNQKLTHLDIDLDGNTFDDFDIQALVKTIDELYNESEEIHSDRGAYDLLSNDIAIRNQLNDLFKNLETGTINKEFLNFLFELLRKYTSCENIEKNKEEIKQNLLKQMDIKDYLQVDLILDIVINNFTKVKEAISQIDYNIPKAIDENLKSQVPEQQLKKIISVTTLNVMDLDKIEILIQIANGRMKDGKNDYITIKGDGKEEVIKMFIDILKKYGITDLNFIEEKIESKLVLTDKNIIKIPFDLINEIVEKCQKLRPNLNKDVVKKDLIFSISLPVDDDKIDSKEYFLFGEKPNANNFTRDDNFLAKQWWRMEQFILQNMRLVSSFKAIKELNVLDGIISYYSVNNNDNPSIDNKICADIMKPIVYYVKKFIDFALLYAEQEKLVSFTPEHINKIRKQTNDKIKEETGFPENSCYLDTMVELYDNSVNEKTNWEDTLKQRK